MNVNDSTPHFQGLSCVKTPLGLWDIDTPKSVVSQMNYRLNIICSMHLLNMYILIYLITYISYIYILIIYVHICTHALNVQKNTVHPHMGASLESSQVALLPVLYLGHKNLHQDQWTRHQWV